MASAIVLLYLGYYYLKGVDFFSNVKKYYAVYDNVDKLALSNQVYLNGFSVGRVSDISIQQVNSNKVLVELEIDSDIVLGDSTVAILSGDFLGSKYIWLNIGTITRRLNPGDTIIAVLDKGLAELLEQAAPVADNLQTTLRKLNAVLENLERNSAKLDGIFNDLEVTPKLLNRTIASVGGNVDKITGNFDTISTNLNSALNDLKPTLSNFKTLSDSLKMIQISGTLTKLQFTLSKINEALAKLSSGENTVGKLMNDDEIYSNLNTLLLRLDSLADHLNENPKHFFSPFGKSRKKIREELKEQGKTEGVSSN